MSHQIPERHNCPSGGGEVAVELGGGVPGAVGVAVDVGCDVGVGVGGWDVNLGVGVCGAGEAAVRDGDGFAVVGEMDSGAARGGALLGGGALVVGDSPGDVGPAVSATPLAVALAEPGELPAAACRGACDPVSASTVTIPVAMTATRTPTANSVLARRRSEPGSGGPHPRQVVGVLVGVGFGVGVGVRVCVGVGDDEDDGEGATGRTACALASVTIVALIAATTHTVTAAIAVARPGLALILLQLRKPRIRRRPVGSGVPAGRAWWPSAVATALSSACSSTGSRKPGGRSASGSMRDSTSGRSAPCR